TSLGRVSIARWADVAETTLIARPPRGGEEVPVQISRLLHAHEIVIEEARAMARKAAEAGDDGTNDLLVSSVIRTNEMQVWFVAEHVVDAPLVHADAQAGNRLVRPPPHLLHRVRLRGVPRQVMDLHPLAPPRRVLPDYR